MLPSFLDACYLFLPSFVSLKAARMQIIAVCALTLKLGLNLVTFLLESGVVRFMSVGNVIWEVTGIGSGTRIFVLQFSMLLAQIVVPSGESVVGRLNLCGISAHRFQINLFCIIASNFGTVSLAKRHIFNEYPSMPLCPGSKRN